MMNKIAAVICCMVLAACSSPRCPETGGDPYPQLLGWLHGNWMIDHGDVKVYESWKQESEDELKGVAYVVKGSDTIVTEDMRIKNIGGTMVFIAKINDQPPVLFSSKGDINDTAFVFENPEHDFPQQVIYRSDGGHGMFARVKGKEHGREKQEDYQYKRMIEAPKK